MTEVTFDEFSKLAQRRGWTVQYLAERFRGVIDEPSEFFNRVLNCRHQGEYRGDLVIPYRSVVEMYQCEVTLQQQEAGHERFCACGCGARVWDRKKWASGACRKRWQRTGSRTAFSAFVSA